MKMLTILLFGVPVLLVLVVVLSIPAAWGAMLLLGAAHSVEPMIPALGFWPTFALALALRLVTAQPTPTTSRT